MAVLSQRKLNKLHVVGSNVFVPFPPPVLYKFHVAEFVLNKNVMCLGTVIQTKTFEGDFKKAGGSGEDCVEIRVLTRSLSTK